MGSVLATEFEFYFLLDEDNSIHIPIHDYKGGQFFSPGTVESDMVCIETIRDPVKNMMHQKNETN